MIITVGPNATATHASCPTHQAYRQAMRLVLHLGDSGIHNTSESITMDANCLIHCRTVRLGEPAILSDGGIRSGEVGVLLRTTAYST
jgi:hypothetical protein